MVIKMPACVASAELYVKTRIALERLHDYAFQLRGLALRYSDKRGLRIIENIIGNTEKLIRDLASWDEDEEICYDEFYSRMRMYALSLNKLAEKYELMEKKYSSS